MSVADLEHSRNVIACGIDGNRTVASWHQCRNDRAYLAAERLFELFLAQFKFHEVSIGQHGHGLEKVQALANAAKAASPSSSGRAAPAATASTTRNVNISLNGVTTPINVASDAQTNALTQLLQQPTAAANRSSVPG